MQVGATMVRGGARRASSLLGRTLNAALHPLQSELSAALDYAASIALFTVKFWAFVFVAVGWMVGLACSSAITYLLIYSWMIPQYSCQLPVHFDVSTPLVNPHATVQLQGERQWRYTELTNLDGVEQTKSRYLSPGHQYNAYLDLVFPDSVVNHDCGMQSVELLVLHDGVLLASSLQSFTPHYSSPLVRWMWSWTWALPLVTGLLHEQQSLTLHMFDALTEQESYPATHVKVLLKSPSAHRFQIYSATLRLQVQLYGVRYLMYHWAWTTGLLVTGAIFGFQLFWSALLLALVCLWCCGAGATSAQEDEEEEEAEAAAALARAQEQEAAAAAAAAAASLAFEGKPQPQPLFQGHAYRASGSGGNIAASFEGVRSGDNGGGSASTKPRSSSRGSHSSGSGVVSSQRSTPTRPSSSSSQSAASLSPSAADPAVPIPATASLLAAAVKLEDDDDDDTASEGDGEFDEPLSSSSAAIKHEQLDPAVPAADGDEQQQAHAPSAAAAHAQPTTLRHRAPKHHTQKHPHPHPPHPAHARAQTATHQADASAAHASDAQPGHASAAAPASAAP